MILKFLKQLFCIHKLCVFTVTENQKELLKEFDIECHSTDEINCCFDTKKIFPNYRKLTTKPSPKGHLLCTHDFDAACLKCDKLFPKLSKRLFEFQTFFAKRSTLINKINKIYNKQNSNNEKDEIGKLSFIEENK